MDALLWGPVYLIQIFLFGFSPAVAILALLVVGTVSAAYPVIFHAKWGQTVGKMATGIKVVRLDGSPIGGDRALLRSSVDLLLWGIYLVSSVYVLATWAGPAWAFLDWMAKQRLIGERSALYGIHNLLIQVWTWSEVVVLLLNRRRRALHDFIAGTVVVRVAGHTRELEVPQSAVGTS